jgi:DNA-binding transcriptional MocR family regulator
MAFFGQSGKYDVHLEHVKTRYVHQRDALVAALKEQLPDVSIESPAGGWFIWLALPPQLSATDLLDTAEEHGVSFVPGSRFYVDHRLDDHVRLSFSMLDADDLRTAAVRLSSALHYS